MRDFVMVEEEFVNLFVYEFLIKEFVSNLMNVEV